MKQVELLSLQETLCNPKICHMSSAVAEMGYRGHNRHGPKRGGCSAHFAGSWVPV